MHKRRVLFVSKVVSQSLRTTKHYLLISACVPPQAQRVNECSFCICLMPSPPPSYLSVLWVFFCSPNYLSLESSVTQLDKHSPVI